MPLSPELVHQRLTAAAARYRRLRCMRQLLSAGAVALGMLTLLLLADAQFHFGSAIRWVAFLLVTGPLVAGVALSVRSFLPRITAASIARRIEVATANSGNTLISAVQFDRELPADSAFRKALFAEMNDPFPQVNWAEVFNFKLLQRLGLGLGLAVVILGVWAMARPLYFANSAARIFLPGKAIAPLTKTRIVSVTPGSTRVMHGGSLELKLELAGDLPRSAAVYTRESNGPWQKTLLDHEVGSPRFSYKWSEIKTPFSYQLEAGDASSEEFKVLIRPRTAVLEREAQLEPPAYTKLKAEERSGFTSLQNVIPGTKATLNLTFNYELEALRCSEGLAASKLSARQWQLTGTLKQNVDLKISYRDSEGLEDSETLPVVVAPDEPPRITVSTPAEGKELFAAKEDSLTITFKASDNFGLGSLTLYRTSDQEQEPIHSWNDVAGKKEYSQSIKIPLAKYARNDQVSLALKLEDQNNVSGPGVTWSRPLLITLRSEKQLAQQEEDNAKKQAAAFEALLKLQATNLSETQKALTQKPAELQPLLERQTQVSEMTNGLLLSEQLAPETRSNLAGLFAKEMPAAIVALRTAVAAKSDQSIAPLTAAVELEATILARLKGALNSAENDAVRAKVQETISGLEELLRNQRELLRATQAASEQPKELAQRQDQLATKAISVRKTLEKSAQDASLGDQDFRKRLEQVATMFGQLKVYEEMLDAAEKLESKALPAAAELQTSVVANLAKMVELLNQWQMTNAKREADAVKEAAKEMAGKLEKLAEIQREVLEKSKEIARKADMRPEDAATAKEMQQAKELMAEVVEQMLTDAHVFPDLKPSNELRGELTQIYEDVIQADKADAQAGDLKPKEVAVQKEESLLNAIEAAKKVAEDMEMWLPNTNDVTKWLMENFDKTEMPDIPNLPLPDAFEDLVGTLLEEQQGLAEQVQDATSNNALAMAPQGWSVTEGPMPGFSAQGKSGNTRPNKNEQTGRSSGGREGMTSGEMVGDTASTLEGSTPDARRTNDPMQQGQVKDDGGIQQARATGGGKAGGFSDRTGMDGNAPVRPSNAPRMSSNDALAVQQALLAEKTAKTYGNANLLYLRARGLPDVARLMEESQQALAENRIDDFRSLHQRIVGRLNEVKGAIVPGEVLSITGDSKRPYSDKQLLGGDEGQAPPAYQRAVSDYYRALQE